MRQRSIRSRPPPTYAEDQNVEHRQLAYQPILKGFPECPMPDHNIIGGVEADKSDHNPLFIEPHLIYWDIGYLIMTRRELGSRIQLSLRVVDSHRSLAKSYC